MLVCSVPPFGHDTDSLDDVSCWSSHVFSFCIGFTWQCSLLFVFRGGNIHNFEGIYAKGYYHGCGLRTQLPQAYFYDIFLQSLSLSPCYLQIQMKSNLSPLDKEAQSAFITPSPKNITLVLVGRTCIYVWNWSSVCIL